MTVLLLFRYFALLLITFRKSLAEQQLFVKATLTACTTPSSACSWHEMHPKSFYDIKNEKFHFDNDRETNAVDSCGRKLHISVRIINSGMVSGDMDLMVIDEVENLPELNQSRLLHPIIVKMQRHQPQVFYPLTQLKVVNGMKVDPTTQIKNETKKVCRSVTCDNGKTVQGTDTACCPCTKPNEDDGNKLTRKKRQNVVKRSPTVTQKDILIHVLSTECKENPPPNFFFAHDRELIEGSYPSKCQSNKKTGNAPAQNIKSGTVKNTVLKYVHNNPKPAKDAKNYKIELEPLALDEDDYYDDYETDYETTTTTTEKTGMKEFHVLSSIRDKRKMEESKDSLRRRIDKERYEKVLKRHRSTKITRQSCTQNDKENCMAFNDLRYSVYEILDPIIIQEISIQVFQKKSDLSGRPYWVDLTRGKSINLGTFHPRARDEEPTITFMYEYPHSGKCSNELCPIKNEENYLLIPTQMNDLSDSGQHPEVQGGLNEYMVVPHEDVSVLRSTCDKDNVSKTTERSCQKKEGICLNNQPVDLWLKDMERKLNGERGKYFLENLASVPLTLSTYNYEGDFLALDATGPFESYVDIEMRADMNAMVQNASFFPQITDCSVELPTGCMKDGPVVSIAPLQRHVFRISLEGPMPSESMKCTVEIMNQNQERIASREILIEKQKRCLCAFHFSCSCVSNKDESHECAVLMQEEYAAAGYKRIARQQLLVLPILAVHLEYWHISIAVFAILLLLGKVKVICGMKSMKIRRYGMSYLRDSPKCCREYKPDRRKEIHWGYEVLLNALFFILFPLKIVIALLISCPCISQACEAVMRLRHRKPKEDGAIKKGGIRAVKSTDDGFLLSGNQEKDECEEIN